MRILLAALVRSVVMGASLIVYQLALPALFPDDGGGANIGAGLIAFAALVVISLVWATFDAHSREFTATASIWAVVAAVVSIGWLIVFAIGEADSSISVTELIRGDFGLVPFTAGLILAPAILGAAIGHALRPARLQT